MSCDPWTLSAWTDLARVFQPYFILLLVIPLVLRVLRAYERYLELLGMLEHRRGPPRNGSAE